jgi:hypothetical protein
MRTKVAPDTTDPALPVPTQSDKAEETDANTWPTEEMETRTLPMQGDKTDEAVANTLLHISQVCCKNPTAGTLLMTVLFI